MRADRVEGLRSDRSLEILIVVDLGECVGCGEEIASGRLRVMPVVLFCIAYAERGGA